MSKAHTWLGTVCPLGYSGPRPFKGASCPLFLSKPPVFLPNPPSSSLDFNV